MGSGVEGNVPLAKDQGRPLCFVYVWRHAADHISHRPLLHDSSPFEMTFTSEISELSKSKENWGALWSYSNSEAPSAEHHIVLHYHSSLWVNITVRWQPWQHTTLQQPPEEITGVFSFCLYIPLPWIRSEDWWPTHGTTVNTPMQQWKTDGTCVVEIDDWHSDVK